MRNRIALAFAALIFGACNQNENKSTNDRLVDTATVSADTTAKDTVAAVDDPVLAIRRRVEHINTAKLDSQHVEFMCDEKTKVDRFYENEKIVKISVDFGWIGDVYAKEDYYYDEGKLIFMYEYVESGPACEGCIKTNEYRYYIKDGQVFKYLKDKTEEKCRKCEFGTKSRQLKLLAAKNKEEIMAIVCR